MIYYLDYNHIHLDLIYIDFLASDTTKKFSDLIEEYIENKKNNYTLTLSCEDNNIELPDIILSI